MDENGNFHPSLRDINGNPCGETSPKKSSTIIPQVKKKGLLSKFLGLFGRPGQRTLTVMMAGKVGKAKAMNDLRMKSEKGSQKSKTPSTKQSHKEFFVTRSGSMKELSPDSSLGIKESIHERKESLSQFGSENNDSKEVQDDAMKKVEESESSSQLKSSRGSGIFSVTSSKQNSENKESDKNKAAKRVPKKPTRTAQVPRSKSRLRGKVKEDGKVRFSRHIGKVGGIDMFEEEDVSYPCCCPPPPCCCPPPPSYCIPYMHYTIPVAQIFKREQLGHRNWYIIENPRDPYLISRHPDTFYNQNQPRESGGMYTSNGRSSTPPINPDSERGKEVPW